MKKSIYILLLTVALFGLIGCASKSEKENAAAVLSVPSDEARKTEERREASEKKRAALAEKRKLALEERLKAATTYKDKDGNLVYNKAEQDPIFNGGDNAMHAYFKKNVKFPEAAAKEGLDGTVYVDFVVEPSGRVSDVAATNLDGEIIDQRFVDEAVRVVSAMPNWIPGRQHGKAVAVSFSVPVTFAISE